eukprot:jgi/Ulvmu1/11457/UM076_0033.1
MDSRSVATGSRLSVTSTSAGHARRQAPSGAPLPGFPQSRPAEDLLHRLGFVYKAEGEASVSEHRSSAHLQLTGLPQAGGHGDPHQDSGQPENSSQAYADLDSLRLEKRRARNRASQRRLRQKQKEEQSALHAHLSRIQQLISQGRATLASLHQQRTSLRNRITAALAAQLSTPAAQDSCDLSAAPVQAPPADAPTRPPDDKVLLPQGSRNQGSGRPSSAVTQRRQQLTRDALLPQPIGKFECCTDITFRDIVGSPLHKRDVAGRMTVCVRKVVEQCRFLKAWEMQTTPAQVCWFMQTQYEVAPGLAVSYSTTLSSPECVGSMVLHMLACYLEFSLFTALDEPQRIHQPTPAKRRARTASTTMHQASTSHRPQTQQQPQPRGSKPGDAPPAARKPAAGAATCGAAGPSPVKPAPPAAAARAMPPPTPPPLPEAAPEPAPLVSAAWSGLVRCGVNDTCAAQAAIEAVVSSVHSTFRDHLSPATLKWACNQMCSHLDDLLFATFAPQVAPTSKSSMPAVPGRAGDDVEEYHSTVAEAMAYVLPNFQKCLLRVSGDTLPTAVEGSNVQQGPANGDWLRPTVEPQHGKLPQHAPHAQHASLPSSMAGIGAGAARQNPREDLQERAYMVMTLFSAGHMLLLADASRIIRRLSVNGTVPIIQQYQVENMHVRVYRALQLTSDQRNTMADIWSEWEQRRRSVDAPVATARDCLDALPQFIPIPAVFAQHVFDIAQGKPAAAAAARDAPTNPAPWEREAVVPLLGAASDFAEPAAEALRLLWYSQEAEASVSTCMIARRLQPGHAMSVSQQMRLYSAHLKYVGAPFVDFLALCQLAVMHQRRNKLFHAPASPYGPDFRRDNPEVTAPYNATAHANLIQVPSCDKLL